VLPLLDVDGRDGMRQAVVVIQEWGVGVRLRLRGSKHQDFREGRRDFPEGQKLF
jgi:hypothetical protein